MKFRTQLNINDKRFVNNDPIKYEAIDKIDPTTSGVTRMLDSQIFSFVSDDVKTKVIFEDFEFDVKSVFLEPIMLTNSDAEFKLKPFFFEDGDEIKALELLFDIIEINQNEDFTFTGKGMTSEYIEYSATTIPETEPTEVRYNQELHTQSIIAEDNYIILNFNGNHRSSIGGGLILKSGKSEEIDSSIITNKYGFWEVSPGIILPRFDVNVDLENKGLISWDNNNLYIVTDYGIKKVELTKI